MTQRSDTSNAEEGFTVTELLVASAILMVALAALVGSLVSLQNTSQFQAGRTRALDDLRTTAGTFAKDARHAAGVTSAANDKVTMSTYVNGALQTVSYEVVLNSAGERNLVRTSGGGQRLFVIRLTDNSIFEYDVADPTTDPESIRRIALHMESKPNTKFPAVVLETEVSLRNVTA